MELALLLVLVTFVELALTVWLLARQRVYRADIKLLTKRVNHLEKTNEPTALPETGTDVAALVTQATPQDVEQAMAVLKAFGLDRQDDGRE